MFVIHGSYYIIGVAKTTLGTHYLLAFDGDDHFGPLAFGTKMDCIMGSTGGRFMPIYDLGRDDDDAPDASRGCFDADDDEDDWGAFVGCGWVVVVRERESGARGWELGWRGYNNQRSN